MHHDEIQSSFFSKLRTKLTSEGSIMTKIELDYSTVATFNSCSNNVGRPGMIRDRTPDFHPVSWP